MLFQMISSVRQPVCHSKNQLGFHVVTIPYSTKSTSLWFLFSLWTLQIILFILILID